MKVLYNWLKEFVEVTATPAELRSRLSLSGTAVDAIEESAAGPVLDAELTSNRADCLGHYGIAREIAALYRVSLKPVRPKLTESSEAVSKATRVEIDSTDLCARYTARVLRGVKVQPSPDWLRQRLEALGHASINNVVDATNYVMLELGQPLHAFDLDKLAESRIVVRRARPGEKMRTLDGNERTLTKDMCVIADAAHAVGIGGVMGGAESEIGFSTRNILIEAAWFDPIYSPNFENFGTAHRGFDALRARSRHRDGRIGLAPDGGADSAAWRRRNSRGRGGCLPKPRATAKTGTDANGISARDGRGCPGSRD
jgi:phenylalanyl-tRNA synthetase beta chain